MSSVPLALVTVVTVLPEEVGASRGAPRRTCMRQHELSPELRYYCHYHVTLLASLDGFLRIF
jgi:hypothetical protein